MLKLKETMIVKQIKWQEFHENGQLHIDGEIGIVANMSKHLYDYRTEWKGYEGEAVVRLGVWTNYYDNGQVWWKYDFRESLYDSKLMSQNFTSYRKDGSLIDV